MDDQTFETSLFFRCPMCASSDFVNVVVPEFDFTSDKISAHVSEGPVTIACSSCEHEFDGTAYCNPAECTIKLDGFDGLTFYGDPPHYSADDAEFWANYDPPDSPFRVFNESIANMLKLLEKRIEIWGDRQLFERMIFSQSITIMEQYLFDRAVKDVLRDYGMVLKLISKDKILSAEKYSLHEIATESKLVENKVKAHLSKILYHNLPRVKVLYGILYSVDISYSKDDWQILSKSMVHRHDCVHRNGHDVDGKKHQVFTREYVEDIIMKIRNLVDYIEKVSIRHFELDDYF